VLKANPCIWIQRNLPPYSIDIQDTCMSPPEFTTDGSAPMRKRRKYRSRKNRMRRDTRPANLRPTYFTPGAKDYVGDGWNKSQAAIEHAAKTGEHSSLEAQIARLDASRVASSENSALNESGAKLNAKQRRKLKRQQDRAAAAAAGADAAPAGDVSASGSVGGTDAVADPAMKLNAKQRRKFRRQQEREAAKKAEAATAAAGTGSVQEEDEGKAVSDPAVVDRPPAAPALDETEDERTRESVAATGQETKKPKKKRKAASLTEEQIAAKKAKFAAKKKRRAERKAAATKAAATKAAAAAAAPAPSP
jgi:hypothetical protein